MAVEKAILATLRRHDAKSTRVLLICGTIDRASTQAVLLCDIQLQDKVGLCESATLCVCQHDLTTLRCLLTDSCADGAALRRCSHDIVQILTQNLHFWDAGEEE